MILRNPTRQCKPFSCSTKMTVEVVDDLESLERHVAAWQDLASNAIEPNVFYEPWMLIPAIRAFGSEADLMFVFIYSNAKEHLPPRLCGFFPLERKRKFRGFPMPFLRLWRHLHCYLTTPLIRADVASKAIRTFLEWLQHNQLGCPLMELPRVSGDGRFLQELAAELWPKDCYVRTYSRAMIRAREDADTYVKRALSGNRRREVARMRRRLAENGIVTSRQIEQISDEPSIVDRFLKLEASGWKGKEGVALQCDDNSRAYFTEITRAGLDRRQLMFSCLMLDDEPIAISCDLFSPPGCFAFKITYDQKYSSFAPGLQLALEHVQFVHSRPEIHWMDSCTAPGSRWTNSLWSDKKTVTTMLVPTGMMGSELAIGLFPLFHWMKHKIRRKR